jgi:spermidine synthase
VFDYVRRMGDVLDAVGEPGAALRVLHVGGAGLTLPRYVAATRPGSWQAVLEPDEELTARVRAELPLPRRSGIRVRPVDGRRGLPQVRAGSVAVVVLDAYRDGRVPPDLLTVECFADVARVLAPGGLLLLNLSDRAPFALARDVVSGLRACFEALLVGAEPATLKGRRPGNLLLVASDGELPAAALRRAAATSASPYRLVTGRDVGSVFGGGTPLRDP